MEDAGTNELSQGEIDGISCYSSDGEQNSQQPSIQYFESRNGAQGKKKRIPWKDWGDNQACFAKNYQKDDKVNPYAKKLDGRV